MRKGSEQALLVGVETSGQNKDFLRGSLDELKRLADTAGASVVGEITQKRPDPEPKYFIGKGKVGEIKVLAKSLGANLAIFNISLSPSQERNLEEELGIKVVDRTELILDIFAQHAKSREGKLQVALAQDSFLLTRLTGHGAMMSRLGGGIGTRGPGESTLEYDRRRIRKRIAELSREIEKVKRERTLRREKRKSSHHPMVSLVGYTNSGKSTLLNTLTKADVLVEDKLFATLDTTTKRLRLSSGDTLLLTDTVGFITDLPHQLVAAFRATLEEVTEADMLLHVVDASSPRYEEQIAAVYRVLEDLHCATKPMITVFNKVDKLSEGIAKEVLEKYAPALNISALEEKGLDELDSMLAKLLFPPPAPPSSTPA